jgi:hypothetical protein
MNLWFLQQLEEIILSNKDKFGSGKNSWYNLLFTSLHIFIAQKYIERETILQKMKSIYDEEQQPSKIGFKLPSRKKQENTLEFGLFRPENVEKLRPIRQENQKLNQEIEILKSFVIFLYNINPRDEIFEEEKFPDLETAFEEWFKKQIEIELTKEAEKSTK